MEELQSQLVHPYPGNKNISDIIKQDTEDCWDVGDTDPDSGNEISYFEDELDEFKDAESGDHTDVDYNEVFSDTIETPTPETHSLEDIAEVDESDATISEGDMKEVFDDLETNRDVEKEMENLKAIYLRHYESIEVVLDEEDPLIEEEFSMTEISDSEMEESEEMKILHQLLHGEGIDGMVMVEGNNPSAETKMEGNKISEQDQLREGGDEVRGFLDDSKETAQSAKLPRKPKRPHKNDDKPLKPDNIDMIDQESIASAHQTSDQTNEEDKDLDIEALREAFAEEEKAQDDEAQAEILVDGEDIDLQDGAGDIDSLDRLHHMLKQNKTFVEYEELTEEEKELGKVFTEDVENSEASMEETLEVEAMNEADLKAAEKGDEVAEFHKVLEVEGMQIPIDEDLSMSENKHGSEDMDQQAVYVLRQAFSKEEMSHGDEAHAEQPLHDEDIDLEDGAGDSDGLERLHHMLKEKGTFREYAILTEEEKELGKVFSEALDKSEISKEEIIEDVPLNEAELNAAEKGDEVAEFHKVLEQDGMQIPVDDDISKKGNDDGMDPQIEKMILAFEGDVLAEEDLPGEINPDDTEENLDEETEEEKIHLANLQAISIGNTVFQQPLTSEEARLRNRFEAEIGSDDNIDNESTGEASLIDDIDVGDGTASSEVQMFHDMLAAEGLKVPEPVTIDADIPDKAEVDMKHAESKQAYEMDELLLQHPDLIDEEENAAELEDMGASAEVTEFLRMLEEEEVGENGDDFPARAFDSIAETTGATPADDGTTEEQNTEDTSGTSETTIVENADASAQESQAVDESAADTGDSTSDSTQQAESDTAATGETTEAADTTADSAAEGTAESGDTGDSTNSGQEAESGAAATGETTEAPDETADKAAEGEDTAESGEATEESAETEDSGEAASTEESTSTKKKFKVKTVKEINKEIKDYFEKECTLL